jgi:hypothetical protein
LLDKVELKALVVYIHPIYRFLAYCNTRIVIGSSLEARGKGIHLRPKAEVLYVIGKWIITWSERERKA